MTDSESESCWTREMSLNKLMVELSAQALAEGDFRQRFRAAQLRGDRYKALQLLDELDHLDNKRTS